MHEKPKASYAEEFLGVRNKKGEKEYYSVFGQYILTPEVFAQLHEDIMKKEIDGDHVSEIELTSALEAVRQRSGMMGVRLQGRMYDMGNPNALIRAVQEFSKAEPTFQIEVQFLESDWDGVTARGKRIPGA